MPQTTWQTVRVNTMRFSDIANANFMEPRPTLGSAMLRFQLAEGVGSHLEFLGSLGTTSIGKEMKPLAS